MKCNSSKGLLKRFIPFFLTFAAGLLIASFFIPVSAPNFQFGRGRRQHKEYDRQREVEIQQLKTKVAQQEEMIRNLERGNVDWNEYGSFDVPAPPLPPVAIDAPPPPPPPRAPAAPQRVK